ncbi:MAG: hypothetical protein KF700_09630 [Hyphomonadaceae bacterium]|nr:hypothetical protein [Hyphomonadaceae bacterium]
MTAIPHAAMALTSALGRFEHSSLQLLEAATGGGDGDLGAALAGMTAAKTQFKAGVAVIRFSEQMWDALIELAQEPQR